MISIELMSPTCNNGIYQSETKTSCKESDLVYIFRGAYETSYKFYKNHESMIVAAYYKDVYQEVAFKANWAGKQRLVLAEFKMVASKLSSLVMCSTSTLAENMKRNRTVASQARKVYATTLKILNNTISYCFYIGIPASEIHGSDISVSEKEILNDYRRNYCNHFPANSVVHSLPFNWKNYYYIINELHKKHHKLEKVSKNNIRLISIIANSTGLHYRTMSTTSYINTIIEKSIVDKTYPAKFLKSLRRKLRAKNPGVLRSKLYSLEQAFKLNSVPIKYHQIINQLVE